MGVPPDGADLALLLVLPFPIHSRILILFVFQASTPVSEASLYYSVVGVRPLQTVLQCSFLVSHVTRFRLNAQGLFPWGPSRRMHGLGPETLAADHIMALVGV